MFQSSWISSNTSVKSHLNAKKVNWVVCRVRHYIKPLIQKWNNIITCRLPNSFCKFHFRKELGYHQKHCTYPSIHLQLHIPLPEHLKLKTSILSMTKTYFLMFELMYEIWIMHCFLTSIFLCWKELAVHSFFIFYNVALMVYESINGRVITFVPINLSTKISCCGIYVTARFSILNKWKIILSTT